jgi:hypothetical protein
MTQPIDDSPEHVITSGATEDAFNMSATLTRLMREWITEADCICTEADRRATEYTDP